MELFRIFGRKYRHPQVLRLMCEILIPLAFLTTRIFAANSNISSISNNMSRVVNSINSPSHSVETLPAKILGDNRFVTGLTFGGFNFKKMRPYFSVDLKNAHNPSFHPLENHHLYDGILLLTLGKITKQKFLKTIGAVLIVDDLIEHSFNVESALHFTANHLDRPLYAKLTEDADKLFGAGKH
jgi:hypothetical protein